MRKANTKTQTHTKRRTHTQTKTNTKPSTNTNAKTMTKYSWKTEIKKKIRIEAQKLLETEIEGLKGYRENIKDEIIVGKKKRYVSLTQKKAKVWFRMRANIIDPAPRRPYNPSSIWKCNSLQNFVMRLNLS